jgi:Xaa-Pro aminopeptidase
MNKQKAFATRREELIERVGKGNAAILFSSTECLRNGDVHFPFRQNSNFYYFTGFNEPEAVALFLPGRAEGEYILLNRPRDPMKEQWEGPRAGQEAACKQYGADQAFDIGLLEDKMLELLSEREILFYELAENKEWDNKIMSWANKLRANRKTSLSLIHLSDLNVIAHELRLIKSLYEIECLKKAAQISAAAHKKLMEICLPGKYEYELEARFNYEIAMKGCIATAYPTIVGGGKNACTLHYIDNKDPLKAGDLVLVDAGAEYEYYASDITRTFPVNGKFSDAQKEIYELVLKAQLAVIKEIKPGLAWNVLQAVAVKVLTKGLVELGIIKLPVQEAIDQKAYQAFYMHNVSHWLGLDVHDVGAYRKHAHWRVLQPGITLTVEPGLYLSASDNLDSVWHNIGVRIEDDILVTENGCEVLTKEVPKTVNEIESLMGAKCLSQNNVNI